MKFKYLTMRFGYKVVNDIFLFVSSPDFIYMGDFDDQRHVAKEDRCGGVFCRQTIT